MFVTKDRPFAGLQMRRVRAIEDTASHIEEHGSSRPFAEHTRGRREAAQVELKRELRASEETVQRLTGASLQGVLIVTNAYEPLLANQTCARIFGFESPAEIMALDSIAGLIASPAPARLDAIGTESLDGSGTTEIHEFDGVRKWFDRSLEVHGQVDRLAGGRRAVVLTLFDITGHEKAEAALTGREAKRGAIMDNAPAETYLKDGDGRVSGLGAIATDVTERKRAEARRTISLCQDGGKRAR